MTIQSIPGYGPYLPAIPLVSFGNGATLLNRDSHVIDATGEKIAFIGRVFNKDRGSKDITKVGITFGTVVKAGGSALTLSLQDVSLTTGPPFQPDETQDQTVAIANAAIATNGFHLTGALSANRTVTFGERLAVVVEFDGSGRLGSDSIAFTHWVRQFIGHSPFEFGSVLKSGSWTAQANYPTVLFEFTDGSFGTFSHCWPCSDINTVGSVDTGSTPDEYGLEFQLPFPCMVDGGWATFYNAANAGWDMVLYDGTTAMTNGTCSTDLNAVYESGAYHIHVVDFSAAISLEANHVYRLIVKPTSANAMYLPVLDVSAAAHMQAVPMGANFYAAHRTDAGAFTTVTTRRPFMGIRLSGLEDAVSAGRRFLLVH